MRKEATVNLTQAPRLTRPRLVILAAVLGIAGLFTAISQTASAQAASGHGTRAGAAASTGRTKPTIVLEHGAFADASSWSGVIQRLQDDGYTVYAPPDPLRGVAYDSQTLAGFLATIHGPVVLAGHSYGGVVIINAAAGEKNVKALVYVDGYIPAQGETAFGLTTAQPGSCLNADPQRSSTSSPIREPRAATPTPTSRWRPTGPTPGSPTASPTACQPARPRSWPPPSDL